MTFIGVDPAMREYGMAAAVITDGKVTFLKYKRYVTFLFDVLNWKTAYHNIIVIIEDSSLQNITFRSSTNKAVLSRLSRNAGMNQAASRIAYEWIKYNNIEVINISPKQKGRKLPKEVLLQTLKKNNLELSGITKIAQITQDMIDAFFLAFTGYQNQKQ